MKTADEKQAHAQEIIQHAQELIKHTTALQNKLWNARDELLQFGELTDAMGALDTRVGSADQKVQLAKTQIYDAIYDLTSKIRQIETAAGLQEDEILQCQVCRCTLDATGLDQQKQYVCGTCRAHNPARLVYLTTAQTA